MSSNLTALFISLFLFAGMGYIAQRFRQVSQSAMEGRLLIALMMDVYSVTDTAGDIEVISDSC